MKQNLHQRFLASLLLFAVSISTYAWDACIDGIYYNLSGEEAEVTYKERENADIIYSGDIVIPREFSYLGNRYRVTSIGRNAFDQCEHLTSITLPHSLTIINEQAFEDCYSLTSITIPEGVVTIGKRAFEKCRSLVSAIIPNSVTSIGGGAFCDCSSLTSVTIGNSVTSIGGGAFCDCSSLTSVTIGNSVTSIGGSAFSGCSGLTSVTCLAEQVPTTEIYCFSGVPQGSATLYVPESSIGLYKSAYRWKDFGTILPIAESEYSVGDANGNGVVEIGDVTSVLTLMATPEATGYNNKAADANGNGEIEIGDVTTILTIMANGGQ